MSEVELTGYLICQSIDEVELVQRYLPEHVRLTRAEAGCLTFEVTQTEDPLRWRVAERFTGPTAFRLHQERVQASPWGARTRHIEREYQITGMPS